MRSTARSITQRTPTGRDCDTTGARWMDPGNDQG
jgi:hypothetical protein